MKLSQWCKEQGVVYGTGLRWFHAGKIPGAVQLDTDTILCPDDFFEKKKSTSQNTISITIADEPDFVKYLAKIIGSLSKDNVKNLKKLLREKPKVSR